MKKSLLGLTGTFLLLANPAFASDITNGFSTADGRIVKITDGSQEKIALHGVNWFGMNTATYAPHGLWGGQSGDYVTSQYNTDLRTMIDRIKGLGFNAVRLPIVFDFVLEPNGKSPNIQQNTNCPYSPNRGEENKPNPNPRLNGAGCNLGFKNSSFEQNAWGYLQYVVAEFGKAGIYVLIDDHYEETVYPADKTQWLNGWKKIAETFKNNPYVIGYDLFNEPDSKGLSWPEWGPDAVAAAQAIYAISPDKLIFIEGTGQGSLGANWGTGFQTSGLSYSDQRNPQQFFFDPLFKADKANPGLLNQVVISPHVYGMDGTNGQTDPQLYDKIGNYDKIFGYLNKAPGVCASGDASQCHIFPLAIGEFGATFGQYQSPFSADGDEQVMNIIGAYLRNENIPANSDDSAVKQGKKYHVKESVQGATSHHNRIYDYFYWSWNPNSGNTGGILGSYEPYSSSLDQGNWTDVVWKKVGYLSLFLDLPAAADSQSDGTTTPSTGELCVTVIKDENQAPELDPSYFQPIVATGQNTTVALTPSSFTNPVCETVPAGSYSIEPGLLYGEKYQYAANRKVSEVTTDQRANTDIQYHAAPIENVEVRLSGLGQDEETILIFTEQNTQTVYEFDYSDGAIMDMVHLDPGHYTVTASQLNDKTLTITPDKFTVEPGEFKLSVQVAYATKAGEGQCQIQFKQQGGAPNQYYANVQYTFSVHIQQLGVSTPTDDWALRLQFGDDVLGLTNYWNMQAPTVVQKIANSKEPFAFNIKPVGAWQAFSDKQAMPFDQVGYIIALNWKEGMATGVNTIPTQVMLTIDGKLVNCTPSLVK